MSNTDEIDHTKTKVFHENDVTPLDKSTGDSNAKTSNIDVSSIENNVDKVIETSKAKGWVQFEDEDNNKPEEHNVPRMETVDLSDKSLPSNFYSYSKH
ncbi:hypothetical protein Bhyg_03522 [Pseudolycoriella hygida]|uniref:Uncharacterized protein n=1 Tax=Pseudolycoriella hygida TaxID=35572 RepID=A0A9Q0S7L0_9DIPT|nr:hypothetical protein Bhyg_03522 [Pseudolycoriella hygida]